MGLIRKLTFDADHLPEVKKIQFGHDWPVVYVLENGTEAYIGESSSATTRFKQHYANPERRKLTRAYLIGDTEFNKSATLDIESKLIQYMAADGVFKLQNGNDGLVDHKYFEKEKYEAKFEIIWDKLQKLQLAQHKLLQLRNLDVFKYSPYKALTDEQFLVVEALFGGLITGQSQTFIVNGEPGTGKTILAIYLMKYLTTQKQTKHFKMGLVIPMTSLRATLKRVFRHVKGLSPSMVLGPSEAANDTYDLLLVDEAHRLRQRVNLTQYGMHDKNNKKFGLGNKGTELDWIIRSSRNQILFYDERQTIKPTDIRPENVKDLGGIEYRLTSQMRVKGGEDYLRFVDELLGGESIKPYHSDKYDFRVCESIYKLQSLIRQRENEDGLARVVAGYAWPWHTSKGTQNYDFEIDGIKFVWNSVQTDWVNSSNAANEVGCIHTIQGYDLNYVGVIIGPEVSYDPVVRKITVDKDKYQDINGKKSISEPGELERYVINIYKTLMTRGIKGCYIYAVDEALSRYLDSLE